jgi:hypothetical protein
MKVLRYVYFGSASKRLRSTYLPWVLPEEDRIIKTIKGFVQETPGWKFDDCGEHKNPYSTRFRVKCSDELSRWTAIPFFHDVRSRCFKSRDPVPEEDGRKVFLDESNRILKRFVQQFRHFTKKTRVIVKVKLTKEEFALKDIITSEIAREQFEAYLRGYPLSWHANDEKQLDRFTVRLERYGEKIDTLGLLRRYLEEDCGWPEADAMRCTERIQVGLDVLRLYASRNSSVKAI